LWFEIRHGQGKKGVAMDKETSASTTGPRWISTFLRHDILTLPESPIERLRMSVANRSDVIGLETGESDLPTPNFICEAASSALRDGKTFYCHGRGIVDLREALAAYHRRWHGCEVDEGRVVVTSSGMAAIMLVGQAVLTKGDTAVVVTPAWPNVSRAFQILGAEIAQVGLRRDNSAALWSFDLSRLFQVCNSRTRLIYLASPGNPTGWTLDRDQAEELLAFARARSITILCDEVYHRLIGPLPTFSILEVARPADPLFVVNSFSKTYAMTGWRVGWLVCPSGCAETIEKLVEFNHCGGAEFAQHGALAAIENGEAFAHQMRQYIAVGRSLVERRLAQIPGVHVLGGPSSIFTLFKVGDDSTAFCQRAMSEARVVLAPGNMFGPGAEGLVRLCHARGGSLLGEAMDRLHRVFQNVQPEELGSSQMSCLDSEKLTATLIA
jgi:aspartate aminotransferase